jgi:hypothetical protein
MGPLHFPFPIYNLGSPSKPLNPPLKPSQHPDPWHCLPVETQSHLKTSLLLSQNFGAVCYHTTRCYPQICCLVSILRIHSAARPHLSFAHLIPSYSVTCVSLPLACWYMWLHSFPSASPSVSLQTFFIDIHIICTSVTSLVLHRSLFASCR